TPGPHNHLPPPAVLKALGDAFKNAPVRNPTDSCAAPPAVCGPTGISAHFDVGSLAAYHAIGPDYQPVVADEYLIASPLARGGELIAETACVNSSTVTCQFPKFPGTVSWKIGYQVLRDAPVGAGGEELAPAQEAMCEASGKCRSRFDTVRKDMFH